MTTVAKGKTLTELEERIWDLEREKLSAKKIEKQLARIDPAIGLAFREGYYLGYHREAFENLRYAFKNEEEAAGTLPDDATWRGEIKLTRKDIARAKSKGIKIPK
jgi:hypothetical protein